MAPTYVLVRTVLKSKPVSHADMQQSDYIPAWSGAQAEGRKPVPSVFRQGKGLIKKISVVGELSTSLYRRYMNSAFGKDSIRESRSLKGIDLRKL